MPQNFEGFSVGNHYNELRDTSVKSLRSFVGTLELFVVGCLLQLTIGSIVQNQK